MTIERINKIIPFENIWIITAPEYMSVITDRYGELCRIVVEPEARNTGPAIFYALRQLEEHENSLIVVTPSDQVIDDEALFAKSIESAFEYAQKNKTIVMCGVKPQYPATQYGYIEYDPKNCSSVIQFHEKPTQEIANHYYNADNFLWNTGIFCAHAAVLADEYKHFTSNCYDTLVHESVDYMILEKSRSLAVIKGKFGWSDVGTIDLFVAAKKEEEKNLVRINAKNVVAHSSKKLVVVMDIDDVCVIETDDVLFVARRSDPEKIKNIVEYLRIHGYEQFT